MVYFRGYGQDENHDNRVGCAVCEKHAGYTDTDTVAVTAKRCRIRIFLMGCTYTVMFAHTGTPIVLDEPGSSIFSLDTTFGILFQCAKSIWTQWFVLIPLGVAVKDFTDVSAEAELWLQVYVKDKRTKFKVPTGA